MALGALLKGRSSSRNLIRELQSSLAWYIGAGLQPQYAYFPTELNAADDPTRSQEVRLPAGSLPSWWEPLLQGDTGELDRWLLAQASDPFQLSGIPPLHDLANPAIDEVLLSCSKRHTRKPKNLRELLKGPPRRQDLRTSSSSSTRLFSTDLATLRGSFIYPKGVDRDAARLEGGYLDLFSGEGGVARELAGLTGRCVISYDIINDSSQNLLDLSVQSEILSLVKSGWVVGLGAAPVCSSMSRAITPSWRSSDFPYGYPWLREDQLRKVTEGNEFAQFAAKVCRVCIEKSIPFWCENPATSFIWWLPEMRSLLDYEGVGFWMCDFCAFGTRWRKRTRFLTNTGLQGKKTLCPGCLRHQVLRGRSSLHRMSWTSSASLPQRITGDGRHGSGCRKRGQT